ncbi:MAG: hypothetical protein OXT67_11490 [Zetaproteobacteria bacterium]|nr:hypothetical protein [Zetaproteobacteria bacterium]
MKGVVFLWFWGLASAVLAQSSLLDRSILTLSGKLHSQRDIELHFAVATALELDPKRYLVDYFELNAKNWNKARLKYEEDMLALLEAHYAGRLGDSARIDARALQRVKQRLRLSKFAAVTDDELNQRIRDLEDISSFLIFQSGGNTNWQRNASGRHRGFWHSGADIFQLIHPLK